MPYIITEACTLDGACVEVCPVACIHTTPDAPQFYIDPEICIECEQCEVVCPVNAIYLHTNLPPHWLPAIEINASFFRQNKPAAGPIPFETAWQMARAGELPTLRLGRSVRVPADALARWIADSTNEPRAAA